MLRSCILLGTAIASFVIPVLQHGAQGIRDERADWLLQHAVKIGSIDPTEDDFTDLMPLVQLIGDARVVSLGEQTHGDGAAFHAKCRLVRFLHQVMGFDVLAWESGFYDCLQVEGALRRGDSIDEAVGKGIFPIWGISQQVRPVFEYVVETRATPRPLEIAGFDCQMTGRQTPARLIAHLEDLNVRLKDSGLTEGDMKTITTTLERLSKGMMVEFAEDELAQFNAAVQTLMTILDSDTPEVQYAVSDAERDLLHRVLKNKSGFVNMAYHYSQRDAMPAALIREPNMAETLIWLANDFYRDRKIIVWAASSHMSANEQLIEMQDGEGSWLPMQNENNQWTPMGHTVRETLGDDLYTIMFIADHGTIGSVAGWSRPLEAAPAGSIDALCHQTNMPYLFVDLRRLPDVEGGSWLREPMVARPRGYGEMRAPWHMIGDAFFFTDQMYPSTRINPSDAN